MPGQTARRASFWVTVAGVSILSQFGLQVLADKLPSKALGQFVAYTNRGGS